MTFVRPRRDAGRIAPRATPTAERRGHRTSARLLGAVGLVLLTVLLFWMLTDETFSVTAESVTFRGLGFADEAEVRAQLGQLERGPNVFRVRASEIVAALTTLPGVDAASARITVPAGVQVTLDERDPVFIWSDGAVSWLVDEEGMLFSPGEQTPEVIDSDDADPGDAADADRAGALGSGTAPRDDLPMVVDARIPDEEPTVGTRLSPEDLAVMRLLLAVTPEMLGSRAEALQLRVDDSDGYALSSSELGWRALFGHYTPSLQSADDIPRQVQCLQALLGRGEGKLQQAWLALSDEACGTYADLARGQGGEG